MNPCFSLTHLNFQTYNVPPRVEGHNPGLFMNHRVSSFANSVTPQRKHHRATYCPLSPSQTAASVFSLSLPPPAPSRLRLPFFHHTHNTEGHPFCAYRSTSYTPFFSLSLSLKPPLLTPHTQVYILFNSPDQEKRFDLRLHI